MITTALVYFAGFVITAVLSALSIFGVSAGFPPALDAGVTMLAGYVSKIDTFIPLSSVHAFMMSVIAFEILVSVFYVTRWLFGYVPVVGGR